MKDFRFPLVSTMPEWEKHFIKTIIYKLKKGEEFYRMIGFTKEDTERENRVRRQEVLGVIKDFINAFHYKKYY